jgi:hypothetical protein
LQTALRTSTGRVSTEAAIPAAVGETQMGLSPWLTQTVKTIFAVRCRFLDRQDHSIAS